MKPEPAECRGLPPWPRTVLPKIARCIGNLHAGPAAAEQDA